MKLDAFGGARTFPAIAGRPTMVPFNYVDTATSRAGIGAVNGKLAGQRIGIAGLGGTGSYILDFVAKTSVAEIHIFDGDVFSQHNAFRAPGARRSKSLERSRRRSPTSRHFTPTCARASSPTTCFSTRANVALLDGLDFVFVCMDVGPAKRAVVERLVATEVPFIEVGMGVLLHDGQLGGIVRTTISTPDTREPGAPHISFAEVTGQQRIRQNIQIAELNAINAAMAVMRWKQLFGIYRDARANFYTGYSIGSGEIVQEGAG